MIDKMSNVIKTGILLSILGLILLITSLIYHLILFSTATYHTDWGPSNFELTYFRVFGIAGIAILIIGVYFYAIGMRDLYFKPLKRLLYPQLKQKTPIKNPNRLESRSIECKNCNRNIPLDSNLCPYCGVKQQSGDDIALKDL